MFHEEAPRAKSDSFSPGQDLSAYAIEELEELKAVLESEIARVEAVVAQKKKGREAADAVFKT